VVAGSPGMNEGARRASGSWIAPLDDDDEFAPDHIERLLALAQTERAELAYGALDRFDVVSGEHERIHAYPPRRGGFTFQGAIYHAGLRFFEYDEESWRLGEPGDWNLCRRMMQAGVRIVATDAVVGTMYRIPFTDKDDEDAPDPVR
jgi:glycosyltransferase involved in cell wall biosynthesis